MAEGEELVAEGERAVAGGEGAVAISPLACSYGIVWHSMAAAAGGDGVLYSVLSHPRPGK